MSTFSLSVESPALFPQTCVVLQYCCHLSVRWTTYVTGLWREGKDDSCCSLCYTCSWHHSGIAQWLEYFVRHRNNLYSNHAPDGPLLRVLDSHVDPSPQTRQKQEFPCQVDHWCWGACRATCLAITGEGVMYSQSPKTITSKPEIPDSINGYCLSMYSYQ